MPIHYDDVLYDKIAKEFSVQLVTIVAQQLNTSPHVDFSLDEITVESMDLLSSLCFFVSILFEENGGIDEAGKRFYPRLCWQRGKAPGLALIVGKSPISSTIDASILELGFERARRSWAPENVTKQT